MSNEIAYYKLGSCVKLRYTSDDCLDVLENGRVIARFDPCFVYELLADNMKTDSKNPSVARRAEKLKPS